MSGAVDWERENSAYLEAALAWLRVRLNRFAQDDPSLADEETVAAEKLERAAAMDPPPALHILAQLFGLSIFEQQVLLLCVANELDTRISAMCAAAQSQPNRPYPTFALALACLDDPSWEALSAHAPLRYWSLIEIYQPAGQTLISSALGIDERVLNFVKGLSVLDERLMSVLFELEPIGAFTPIADSQFVTAQTIADRLEAIQLDEQGVVVQLVGSDRGSKRAVAREVAEQLGLSLYRLPEELLPSNAADLDTVARLWQRESILAPVALYIEAQDSVSEKEEEKEAPGKLLQRFLSRLNGVTFIDTRSAMPGEIFGGMIYDVGLPTAGEQKLVWCESVPEKFAERIVPQFSYNLGAIHKLLNAAISVHEPSFETYWDACRMRSRPRMDQLAQRIDPKSAWDDIVLPEEQLFLLREIADQVGARMRVYEDWGFERKMNRGLGISALFAGESGTGKTMAAEVIANELRLDLYRIDLSSVVSKYIGETEKNLRKLFDAAEAGGVILFFDEADALFGKRSEVRDSHDRYANIEINYLLQRMEAYRGLAILATNMKKALDEAFVRRLRFVVDFPFPGPEQRRAIWERVFPEEVPLSELSFDQLASLPVTGGSIHNIALNAAFLAAANGGKVNMGTLLNAARTEYRKLGRTIDERDFAWAEGLHT